MEGDHEEVLALYAEDPEGEERRVDEEKDDDNKSISDQKSDQLADDETQNKASEVPACNPIARVQSEFLERKEQEEQLRYVNAGGNFFTGVDVDSKEAAERRILRAKRFGVDQNTKPASSGPPQDNKLQQRAKKFGVVSAGELAPLPPLPTEGEVRPEAVHLHGTDEMSNRDVLDYFRAYGPRNVEWINDSSCNIVWDDPQSARRALNQLGKDSQISMEEGEAEEGEGRSAPVLKWRIGVPHPRASQILLRYATTVDKKQVGAAKESQYYKKYGNPNERLGDTRKRRPQPDLRKRLGRKRRASSSEADGEMEKGGVKEEEKVGAKEEEKDGVKEEPMEVEPSLPLAKKPRTLYSDMEGVKSAKPDEEEEESGDLRKRIQQKRILRGKLKQRMGPPQNID